MEKSIGFEFDSYMHEIFKMEEVDINSYSPLTLAYIGDSIYALIIKSIVVNRGNKQVNKLHKDTADLVQASTQSLMMRTMQEHLTEEEHAQVNAAPVFTNFYIETVAMTFYSTATYV